MTQVLLTPGRWLAEAGGSASAKGTSVDHAGREKATIWVEKSGTDLPAAPLDLDDLVLLIDRETLDDARLTTYLLRCRLDPTAAAPSIDSLLHALVPAQQVRHAHSDAIDALAGTRDGEQLVSDCFGDEAVWIPFVKSRFELARLVGDAVRSRPELRLVVLAKNGFVIWGETAEAADRETTRVADEAADFLTERARGVRRFGGAAPKIDDERRRTLLRATLPTLRGAVSRHCPKVLVVDSSPAATDLVSSPRGRTVTSLGAASPDQLASTGHIPLWVSFDPDTEDAASLASRIRTAAADSDTRVVLLEHLGIVGVGTTVEAARASRASYHRAIEVMAAADSLGGFVPLTEAESVAVEHQLALDSPTAPPARELEGQVAFVTGAAGGIGQAVVEALGDSGACVVGFDLDAEGAADAVARLGDAGISVGGDVTSESGVANAFGAAVDAFGGVDVVVSNAGVASSAPVEETSAAEWDRMQSILVTGYFLVAREAFRVLRTQERGGSIIFIGSKNALAAGKNAAAYSVAKAAELHLARCLAEEGGSAGIRVNTVNPDAVLQGSRIWNSSWRAERAAAYGIAPEELEEHYRKRTALAVNVLPADVAQAVLHFASAARSGKSTGNVLNVDGGVVAAYPR